ncbi:hypothetical protein GCM10009678_43090 [Actinomadura kijaniata]
MTRPAARPGPTARQALGRRGPGREGNSGRTGTSRPGAAMGSVRAVEAAEIRWPRAEVRA